jgi:ABC-type oligopeptide transport system substrate-binding subunit
VFGPRVEDPRVREALGLTVDRAAIHRVLLQRQGEISGALLPQWVSGHAFLFPGAVDVPRARMLLAGVPAAMRTLTLAGEDKAIAARIALDAQAAGLIVTLTGSATADVRLVQARVLSTSGFEALPVLAAAFGLPEPPKTATPEALYGAERSLLDGFRVVPLFHIPDLYAVSARVKGGPGISQLGEWRFESLWIDRP